MSDRSERPDWWLASDGKWYTPQSAQPPPPQYGSQPHVATADAPIDIWKSVVTTKYAQFDGRARRAEFWWFSLVNMGFIFTIAILAVVLASASETLAGIGALTYLVYMLAMIVPSLAVAVRRLHDTGKSGAMYLLILIPLVGSIILLVFFATDGDRMANKYGPSPKYIG
jgi:uncharacterized membrane protein YhaH (DUF805 family)